MKRWKRVLVVALVLVVFVAGNVSAGTLLLGGKLWVAQWDPFVAQIWEFIYENDGGYSVDIEKGKGFLVGPMIGYQGDSPISFSAALMYGPFSQSTKVDDGFDSWTVDNELTRTDLDIAISYALNDTFKVFAGYKYQKYIVESTEEGFTLELEGTVHMPGAGAGFAIPVSDTVLLGLQAGGFYVISSFEDQAYEYEMENMFGFNAEANLSFLLSPQWIMQGGYRFQRFSVEFAETDAPDETFTDTFHGLTIGAVYAIRDM